MRLGFISGRSGFMSDKVYADAGLGRLIDGLYENSDNFHAALCVSPDRREIHDHTLKMSPSQLTAFPVMDSFKQGVWRVRACQRVIREVEAKSDVVVIQLPFTAPAALFGAKKPRVYHVCADVYGIVRATSLYRGLMGQVASTTAYSVDQIHRLLLRGDQVRIVTHGRALLNRYPAAHGRAIVSSALYANEIDSVKRQREKDQAFRIVFVGHLRPEKGFEMLFEAFEELLTHRPEAELHLVGPSIERHGQLASKLSDRLQAWIEKGSVFMVGHKRFGPELFQCFADADVLALTSVCEGTPRVLVEARAFRCPVVATDVGGISSSINHEHDGLLVPSRDSSALAQAWLRIAQDEQLRENLTANGLRTASSLTVEAFSSAIVDEAQALYQATQASQTL